jgi:hypothetical protein
MPTNASTSDVADRLAEAAHATILNHRRAIELGAGHVKTVTVEVEVKRNGEVADSRIWLEHVGAHRMKGV